MSEKKKQKKNMRLDLYKVCDAITKKTGKKYTLVKMAEDTGAGYQTLSNINNGRNIPGILMLLCNLSELSGLGVDEILTCEEAKK